MRFRELAMLFIGPLWLGTRYEIICVNVIISAISIDRVENAISRLGLRRLYLIILFVWRKGSVHILV